MGGNGGVVDDDLGVAHQLVTTFDMAWEAHEGVHHPEFGDGQWHLFTLPQHPHALGFDAQWAVLDQAIGCRWFAQRIVAPEQRADPCRQLMEGNVLGEIVVGTETQAGDHIEVRITCGQEQDRQAGRLRAQPAAQIEAAFGFVAKTDIDDDQLGHALGEGAFGFDAAGVAAHFVTGAGQRLDVVGPDQRFVFDDGDAAWHDFTPVVCSELTQRDACAAMRAVQLPANRHI